MVDWFEVCYYNKPDGKVPAALFLDQLSVKMHAKMLRDIELLSKGGPNLREPNSKHIGNGLFELRCQVEGNAARILYFFVAGKRVVLTNGFIKKTNRTPRAVIKEAKAFRKDYLKKEKQGEKNDNQFQR